MAVDADYCEPVSATYFPANRENIREMLKIDESCDIPGSKTGPLVAVFYIISLNN